MKSKLPIDPFLHWLIGTKSCFECIHVWAPHNSDVDNNSCERTSEGQIGKMKVDATHCCEHFKRGNWHYNDKADIMIFC